MERVNKTIAIIGEGITEKYYIESLKDIASQNISILPKSLGTKASNLKQLEKTIIAAKNKGYDEVYCIIDMDSKEKDRTKYEKLKNNYNEKHFINKRQGIDCYVKFIESYRCTEIWFLYYFEYTTRHFNSYDEVQNALRKYTPSYEKTEKFFKNKNLDTFFIKSKGNRTCAINNARKSLKSLKRTGMTGCAFSEMHILLNALGIK